MKKRKLNKYCPRCREEMEIEFKKTIENLGKEELKKIVMGLYIELQRRENQ